jgi:hypothetical protein
MRGGFFMNKQANLVDWAELITNYRASGQSMSSWCQANNLKVHQLTYQLQKEKRTKPLETTNWLPLDLTETVDTAIAVKVGPYQVIVKDGFDPYLLKQVVLTLSSL